MEEQGEGGGLARGKPPQGVGPPREDREVGQGEEGRKDSLLPDPDRGYLVCRHTGL